MYETVHIFLQMFSATNAWRSDDWLFSLLNFKPFWVWGQACKSDDDLSPARSPF